MSLIDKKVSRKQFVTGSAAAASLVVGVWGSSPWLGGVFRQRGQYVFPMRTELWKGVDVRYSVCRQCRSDCGIEARVFNGILMKIDGNPYHPNATEPQASYATPVAEALRWTQPHSVCARGQAGKQSLYDRYRVFYPLKRKGPRGSNQWQAISWDQLVSEVTEGGYLFKNVPGEESRYVEGFKDLWQNGKGRLTPVDPKHPDLGPVTNQFTLFWGRSEPGQNNFLTRFANAFGSVNAMPHVAVCELNHHVATQQSLDGKVAMLKPDIENSEFIIWFGANVYGANFPMQTLARKTAQAAANGTLKFVIVDVTAPNSVLQASRYVPILPGGDGALVLGMIRWILEHHRYDAQFLANTTQASANQAGEPDFTNASYLVVTDPKAPDYRTFLTAERAGLASSGSANASTSVVLDAAGKPQLATGVAQGQLWPTGDLSVKPSQVNGIPVQTSMQLLYQEATRYTLDEYAREAGLSRSVIEELAQEFTSHGKKAVADFYRGPAMHSNGVYAGRGIMTLNFLVGNIDWAGGYIAGGGAADAMGAGGKNPYNLSKWPGQPQGVPGGVHISREGSFYEQSSFYTDAVAAGKSPFPAPRPWFPFGFGIWEEIFAGAWHQYPYPVKIMLMHEGNPGYSAPPGMGGLPDESLPWFRLIKDLKKVPLFIASDIIIAESSSYADYIVPDTSYLETWGALTGFPTTPTSVSGVRQPVVEPLTARTSDGRAMAVETFLIDVAERLGLPGFGENAFLEGGRLHKREDYYLKMVANIAYDGSFLGLSGGQQVKLGPVPDANAAEWQAAERWYKFDPDALTEAQWRKAAYVLARGGRFEDYNLGYLPGNRPTLMTHQFGSKDMPLQIYNPTVATTHNALTGELFHGTARYEPIAFHNGVTMDSVDKTAEYPFHLSTYKQPIHTHARTFANAWLRELMPEGFLDMNPVDAVRLQVADGDQVRVSSATYPQGIVTKVRLMPAVRPGVVTFPNSFGHWHYGSGKWAINGATYAGDPSRNAPVRLNALMRLDPALTDASGWGTCLIDQVGGGCDYYDTRVKIEKV